MMLNKKIVFGLMIPLVLLALFAAGGCVSFYRRQKIDCTWCKVNILDKVYFHGRNGEVGDNRDGRNVGDAPTREEAEEMMRIDAMSHVRVTHEGLPFCSVSCLQAYKASKEAQE